MAESFQKRRNRQRRTRVNIAYDVEIGDAIVKRELPFIMGVMADLAGDGSGDLPDMKDRKFTEIFGGFTSGAFLPDAAAFFTAAFFLGETFPRDLFAVDQ